MMKVGISAIVAMFIASGVGSYLIQTNIEHRTIKVASKERLMSISTNDDGGTSSSWTNFVYSDDEAYVVKDSFWNWHFRAGTVYAQIREGATCNVTLSGYRWGFVSMHQNIIAADCDAPEGNIIGKDIHL